MPSDERYPPIVSYAAVGDGTTVALVGRDGSLDWLCWPRFDSPSVFGALLDRERGGHFRVAPVGRAGVRRRYVEGTNVLETTFETAGGVLRLTDLMPVAFAGSDGTPDGFASTVIRVAECLSGEVELEVDGAPRPDYGRRCPAFDAHEGGFVAMHDGHALVLRSEVPLTTDAETGALRGRATLRAGDRRTAALAYATSGVAVPPLGDDAAVEVERTVRYWKDWSGTCRYEGPYRAAVVRSALALKLLTCASSGAVVAAATTSLPEAVGGVRNWDYRYCWLRDASFTMRALLELGHADEAEAFFRWLVRTTHPARDRLRVLYDLDGGAPPPERELDHLHGWRGSRPVRVGNAASDQLQLDTHGELVAALFESVRRGCPLGDDERALLLDLGDAVCAQWETPDRGIWEIRAEPRQHTHSKAMCWVAMDRLVQLHDEGLVGGDRAAFAEARARIERSVFEHGYDDRLGRFVSVYGTDALDTSLLLLPLYGLVESDDPRMVRTFDAVEKRLGRDGFLYRYDTDTHDGLPPGEGAFGLCSFWAAQYLAERGDVDAAHARIDHILGCASDVGLFAEEVDPETGHALGNFPQAYTHVGLINAALSLANACGEHAGAEMREDLSETRRAPPS